MKKIKLISSLSALGVLATATPLIATSCSTTGKEKQLFVNMNTLLTLGSTETKGTINIISARYDGTEETISAKSTFTYSSSEDKKYISASFDATTQCITVSRTSLEVNDNKSFTIYFNAVDGENHTAKITITIDVKKLEQQDLTDIKYKGFDVAQQINITQSEPLDSIKKDDFTAKIGTSPATLKTLTISSSATDVVEPKKTSGKEEYTFVVNGTGSTIITVTLADVNNKQGYKNIEVNVAKPAVDEEVAYLDLDDASSTAAAIKYNENGTTELGHLIAKAYNKEDQLLENKKIVYTIEQKDRPDWIGNIHCVNGIITAKATDYKPETAESWTTSFYASCEGHITASYPLTFYYIPAIDRSGVIYYDDINDKYSVANFANPAAVTEADLQSLSTADNVTEVTINGKTIAKENIYSLAVYGLETSAVTSIPDNFCNGFTNLWYIDVNPLSAANITSIGEYFMHNCKSLTSVDLSVFTSLGCTQWDQPKIGAGAFNCCDNLTYVNLGDVITEYSFADDDEDYGIYSFATTNRDAACYNPGITMAGKYAADIGIKFAATSSWWYQVYRKIIVA